MNQDSVVITEAQACATLEEVAKGFMNGKKITHASMLLTLEGGQQIMLTESAPGYPVFRVASKAECLAAG